MENEDIQRLGRRMAQARQAADLTQERLAALLSVSKSTVRGWERGRQIPHLDMLVRWAGACRTDLHWLIEEIQPPWRLHRLFPDDHQRRTAVDLLDIYATLESGNRAAVLSLAKSLYADQTRDAK